MSEVSVKNGRVYINEGSYEREIDMDTAEVRTLIAELTAAADEADRQREQIRAACADGHDWDGAMNGMRGQEKLCYRYCKRPGCGERQVLPGWMQFAGRLHIEPITGDRLTCYGPGCDHCDMEALGRAMRKMLADGLSRIESAA